MKEGDLVEGKFDSLLEEWGIYYILQCKRDCLTGDLLKIKVMLIYDSQVRYWAEPEYFRPIYGAKLKKYQKELENLILRTI